MSKIQIIFFLINWQLYIFYFMITSEKHGQLVSGKKYTDTYVLCVGVNMFNRFMCDT